MVCAVALIVLPFDFRQALINSLIGTVMALSLVVITGFVGQISVVQLSLAGVTGFVVSHLAMNAGIRFPLAPLAGTAAAVVLGLLTAVSALRVRGVSLVDRHARRRRRDLRTSTFTTRCSAAETPARRCRNLTCSVSILGSNASFRGLDGNIPSPVFGWVALTAAVLLCLLVGYLRRGGDRPADARRSLQ